MILSILTPTIPGREKQLQALQWKIEEQIQALPTHIEDRSSALRTSGQVEHLILSDNRTRSIGAKRQALLDIARGQYIAFVDDDDDIADTYVAELLASAASGADVITFQQHAVYNGLESTVHFRLGQGDGAFIPGGITQRDAWHVCAWKRDTVAGCQFLETNYGEDRVWSLQARKRAKTTYHIPKILHFYRHDRDLTAAPEK